jgi:CheY-like chemotaxis protein
MMQREKMAYNQDPSSAEDQAPVKTVLVVEDEEELGAFIVQALQQETPYQALFVTDGFQALKMVRSLKPNLFLLDYHLPSMDGIELYDQLRADEELEDIPVVMFTADAPTPELQEREIIFVKKPAELDELLQTIGKVLG